MSEDERVIPIYKPQFVLTVLAQGKSLDKKTYQEIETAIGERTNFKSQNSFDNISNTYRYIFNFNPVNLEKSKRRIQELEHRHKSDLIIFFDPANTFGIRKLLEQIQIALDKIIGFILPTEATLIFKSDKQDEITEIQKSIKSIFFNGNNTIPTINNLKSSKEWRKASFKVIEPIKFKSNFQLFKKQNKGLIVFEDLKRKRLRSYAPYAGFLGIQKRRLLTGRRSITKRHQLDRIAFRHLYYLVPNFLWNRHN